MGKGKDCGCFSKKYGEKVTLDMIKDFYSSGEYDIHTYIENRLNGSLDKDNYDSEDDYEEDYSATSFNTSRVNIDTTPRYTGQSSNTDLSPIMYIIGGFVILFILTKIFGGVAGFIGGVSTNVSNYISKGYEVESFEYDGMHFVGDRSFNKPDGVCYYYNLSEKSIGYYDGGKLKGYGIYDSGNYADIGIFKGAKLNGYGIHEYSGAYYVGKFKNGKPSGYGYMKNSSGEHIIKYKSTSDADYSDDIKIIATKQGNYWYKPNGKEFKIKDNAYKSMEFIGDGRVKIGDITFNINGSYATYKTNEIELELSNSSMYYNTRSGLSSAGVSMKYQDGSLSGSYAYETGGGLQIHTFTYD